MFSGTRKIGPASRTYFRVSPYDHGLDPDLVYSASFQSELSKVHSDLFFLKPYALVRSAIEEKPVLTYFDRAAYDKACTLYPGAQGPLDDLNDCLPFRVRSWAKVYRDEGLIP